MYTPTSRLTPLISNSEETFTDVSWALPPSDVLNIAPAIASGSLHWDPHQAAYWSHSDSACWSWDDRRFGERLCTSGTTAHGSTVDTLSVRISSMAVCVP